MTEDFVEFDVRLDAALALQALAELTNATRSFAKQVEYAKMTVREFARDTGTNFNQAKKVLKDLDSQLSGTATSSVVFGGKGQEAWDKVGNAAEKSGNKMAKGFDVARIAMSIFLYDLVSRGISAITQFFGSAIKQAQEFEASLYRLQSAERILSEGGIEISVKGLKEGIQDVKKLLPIFSEQDITQTVGAISIATKEVGLQEEQILGLTRAAAIFNVQSARNETLLESQSKLVNSIISPQAKTIGEYGIAFSRVTMEAKGLELGILRVGQSVAKLTDAQKAQIKYAIIMDAANANMENLGKYMDTNTARIQQNAAAWEDLKTSVGQALLPFIPLLTSIMTMLTGATNMAKVFFSIHASLIKAILSTIGQLVTGGIKLKETVAYFKYALKDLETQWIKAFFPQVPSNAPEWFKRLHERTVGQQEETPTSQTVTPEMTGAAESGASGYEDAVQESEEKIADIMQEARDKRLDIERDYQRKLQDIARDMANKLADIARDVARKREDALRDYNEKVADINRDAAESTQEAIEDYNEKQEEAEQEHQDNLNKLREKYLMDLAEALHERDARQVLRLMRQYQIDKQAEIDNYTKEREESKRQLQLKLQDIEEERIQKLAAAQRELDEKLAQIQLAAQREREDARIANARALQDARIAHNRQLAEHREYLQRKLRDLAQALAAEYNLTAAGAQNLANLLNSYFGTGGVVSGIFGQATAGMGIPISSGNSQYTSSTPTVSSTWAQAGLYGTGMAEGGTFLATRPTTLNIAENRPELITATPLGRPGANLDKFFTNAEQGGGMSGQIELALSLSPDLEARIVRNTLDKTADVVLRVNRSKI